MIDGERRGEQIGRSIAEKQPDMTGNDHALETFAWCVLAYLTRQGYAHLEPREKFITGFVTGFQQVRLYSASLYSEK